MEAVYNMCSSNNLQSHSLSLSEKEWVKNRMNTFFNYHLADNQYKNVREEWEAKKSHFYQMNDDKMIEYISRFLKEYNVDYVFRSHYDRIGRTPLKKTK